MAADLKVSKEPFESAVSFSLKKLKKPDVYKVKNQTAKGFRAAEIRSEMDFIRCFLLPA